MSKKSLLIAAALTFATTAAHAGGLKVIGKNQDVSKGTVSAETIVAGVNGWMVVHRVKENGKPGPVVGHSPLKAGINTDVTAVLTESVEKGSKLMLMIHAEAGGNKTGIFEYTLGAKEDVPIKVDGNLIMALIEAQ